MVSAIINFHRRRQFILECLRLLSALSIDPNYDDDDVQILARNLVELILETKDGPSRNGSLYIQKCLRAMSDVETWLHTLGDRIQGTKALGQTMAPEYEEVMAFQQSSLSQQHESLGAIVNTLIKASYSAVGDFYRLLEHLPKMDRWNVLAVHYVPVILAFTSHYGSPESSGTLREARMLNDRILDTREAAVWNLRHLQAATITWWLAEYSGWYLEQPIGSPVQGVNFEAEALERSKMFFQALKDGAFQCTLSMCSHITPYEWLDPAKNTLITYLLGDTPLLPQDSILTSAYCQTMIMEQLETFADAFITNMPDTLRRFKFEEDDQRKLSLANPQTTGPGGTPGQDLHLERFLLIIAFAFDNREEAAQSFWSDTDSNLYGFLQWVSKRQSTPCVGAFCEMLRSISKGEECATSAHQFLLEESIISMGKLRRTSSLSWSQILGELSVYTSRIREQPSAPRPTSFYGGKPNPDDIDEPESVLMLESYLRLTAHLCGESTTARSWILTQPNPQIIDTLFYLCNNAVPRRLQSSSFAVLNALLTEKTTEIGTAVWVPLDQWVSGAYSLSPNVPRPSKISHAAAWAEEVTFATIANDFEQAEKFVEVLQSLVSPAAPQNGLNDQLPFPESLGSAYRMAGIEPYVDFILDKLFAYMVPHLDNTLQSQILTWNILNFVVICLSTFNEDLVLLANTSALPVDEAMNASSLSSYVRLHPFSRVMEWMFNERVLATLFTSSHKDVDAVSNASPDSPLVLALIRSLETMNLVMDLQSTYLDIIRPLAKAQSNGRGQSVFNPSLASFEDSVILHLEIIVDLGLYAGIGNQDLAVSSLKLLEKLTSSRKLNILSASHSDQRMHGNRLIGVVEQNNDLERIVRSLCLAMEFDSRELEQGSTASGWTIKNTVLEFLVHNLLASKDRPTLAHALLGFTCSGTTVDIDADSLFANSSSLFHAVLNLAVAYPDGHGNSLQAWALSLRQKALKVLSILWTSPLTSIFVLTELRANDFLFALFLRQKLIDANTEWDGRPISNPSFMFTDSIEAFRDYLWQRCLLLEYTSMELRLVFLEDVPSLMTRIFSTLSGSTTGLGGEHLPNTSIFDLLDFVEIYAFNEIIPPQYSSFKGTDFRISTSPGTEGSVSPHDLRLIDEMIALRMNELRRSGCLQDATEEASVLSEAEHIVRYFQSENSKQLLLFAQQRTLTAWTHLLTLMIDTCDLDVGGKSALVLQALQIVTPKLETYALNDNPGVNSIARLINILLLQLDFSSSVLDRSRVGDAANDRLFQVFRTALRAISNSELGVQLREMLYSICYRYLSGISDVSDAPIRRRHGIQTLRTTGERTMNVICDDAYGSSATCRISALLLLDALGSLAQADKSNYIMDSLVRTNFLQIMVQSIEDIPQELRESHPAGNTPVEMSHRPLLTWISLRH